MVTALKYFLLGLGIGLLTAPRSGEETRRLLVDQFFAYLDQWLAPADIESEDWGDEPLDGEGGPAMDGVSTSTISGTASAS
ncbi:MAG: hypothetical protein HY329_10125 [Chloroflexi bacterium]|nr:hypothetical protein [Chloroflexota bacterium]